MRTQLIDYMAKLENPKAELTDQINKEFVTHKLMINEIVEEAKKEFGSVQTGHRVLYGKINIAVDSLGVRIEAVERGAKVDKVRVRSAGTCR